ncbi:MAG: hypothetical protein VX290_01565 [Candidatus Latescibacterota bacterium]|nr:hypothetical protein [Candidatus Latescibacterota bacterium]
MRARGHLLGGVVAGASVAGVGTLTGHLHGPAEFNWWVVAGTGVFFSLFPDVDTDSLPRRWFYRAVVVALVGLVWMGESRLGNWLAILAMLPLLDHHRGWTHGRWMPLLGAGLLGLGAAFAFRTEPLSVTSFYGHGGSVGVVYFVAAVVGWYTHLLLDGLFHLFPDDPQ